MDKPTDEEILDELRRVVGSATFKQKRRLRPFLEHLVMKALKEQLADLSESCLSQDFFEVKVGPTDNSIVRANARNLKRALHQYYLVEGESDLIEIQFKGKEGYVPEFDFRFPEQQPRTEPPPMQRHKLLLEIDATRSALPSLYAHLNNAVLEAPPGAIRVGFARFDSAFVYLTASDEGYALLYEMMQTGELERVLGAPVLSLTDERFGNAAIQQRSQSTLWSAYALQSLPYEHHVRTVRITAISVQSEVHKMGVSIISIEGHRLISRSENTVAFDLVDPPYEVTFDIPVAEGSLSRFAVRVAAVGLDRKKADLDDGFTTVVDILSASYGDTDRFDVMCLVKRLRTNIVDPSEALSVTRAHEESITRDLLREAFSNTRK